MNLERTQLYVNYADLEPMPMQRQTAPRIIRQTRHLKVCLQEVRFQTVNMNGLQQGNMQIKYCVHITINSY